MAHQAQEPDQGPRSYAAFRAWEDELLKTGDKSSDVISIEVQLRRLRRELKAAKAAHAEQQAAEDAASAAYFAVPYDE